MQWAPLVGNYAMYCHLLWPLFQWIYGLCCFQRSTVDGHCSTTVSKTPCKTVARIMSHTRPQIRFFKNVLQLLPMKTDPRYTSLFLTDYSLVYFRPAYLNKIFPLCTEPSRTQRIEKQGLICILQVLLLALALGMPVYIFGELGTLVSCYFLF